MRVQDARGIGHGELSGRVDTVGWGLLFLAVGTVGLVPGLPEGAWLIAAGIVMLGVCIVRAQLRLPVRGVTAIVGTVALVAGIGAVAGLAASTGPLVLIVLGLALIVGALYRAQRWTDIASVSEG